MDAKEERAKKIYEAMLITVEKVGAVKLFVVAGEMRRNAPWDKTGSMTRELFLQLAANLTV